MKEASNFLLLKEYIALRTPCDIYSTDRKKCCCLGLHIFQRYNKRISKNRTYIYDVSSIYTTKKNENHSKSHKFMERFLFFKTLNLILLVLLNKV